MQQESDEQAVGESGARQQLEGEEEGSRRHRPYAILRNRDFVLYTLAPGRDSYQSPTLPSG